MDIASLGFSVDSTPVKTAAVDLDKLVDSSGKAEKAATTAGRVWSEAAKTIAGNTNAIVQQMAMLNATQSSTVQLLATFGSKLDSIATSSSAMANAIKENAAAFSAEAAGANVSKAAIEQMTQAHVKAMSSIEAAGAAAINSASMMRTASISMTTAVSQGNAAIRQQKDDLATLLGKIDPVVAALGRLDEQEKALAGYKSKGLIDAETFKDYQAKLDASRLAIGKFDADLKKAGVSAGQTKAALAQLPAQLTDIVTQLAGGQSAGLILIQQGGQIKDSFGGIGNTIKQLGTFLTPLNVALGGTAAAAAAMSLAYYQGSQEVQAYKTALILTGNAAGTTAGQLDQMARSIGAGTATVGQAADALAQFAASGKVGRENLEQFASTAVNAQRIVGTAVADTVQVYAELAKAPLEATLKYSESMHYLTTATYEQIKALVEQGRTQEAATVAQKAYAEAQASTTRQVEGNLSNLQRAWKSVGESASKAWDVMLNIGREKTVEQKIADLKSLQDYTNANASDATKSLLKKFNDEQNAQIASLQLTKKQADAEAELKGKKAESTLETVKAIEANKKLTDSVMSNQQKINKELEDYRRNNEVINKDRASRGLEPISQAQISMVEQNIRDKYPEKKAAGGRKDTSAAQTAKAQLGYDIDAIRNAAEEIGNAYSNAEKIVEARRAAGLLGEQEYFDAKQAFVNLNRDLAVKELQDENTRIAAADVTGKDKINNDKKIADNLSKIRQLNDNAATSSENLRTKQTTAAAAIVASYEAARQSAQSYIDTVNKQYERDLAGVGQGVQNRSKNAGFSQIEDKYQAQRTELNNQTALLIAQQENGLTAEQQKQYDARLAIIDEYEKKALAGYDNYYNGITAKQSDWSNGASEALQNYYDQARNVASGAESLFSNAFKGMEDSLVDFATTGKLNFSNLAKSIIADMVRIQAKSQVSGILSFVGNLFAPEVTDTGVSGDSIRLGQPRAAGGPVSANSIQRVNELGPELLTTGGKTFLMMGAQGGSITPNSAISGAGRTGVIVNVVNQNNSSIDVQQTQTDSGLQVDVLVRQIEGQLAANVGMGTGALYSSLRNNFGMKRTV